MVVHTVDYMTDAVTAYMNRGKGNFVPETKSLNVLDAYDYSLGDLDGDGIADLMVVSDNALGLAMKVPSGGFHQRFSFMINSRILHTQRI